MKAILSCAGLALLATAVPAAASAQTPLEGRWKNEKGSVIVRVAPCGSAYCGTVSWASSKNREKGVEPGARVLTDLRQVSGGVYRGRAFDPKHGVAGSATVRQSGDNVMIVRGCAVAGLVCKEQRWTRVS
ncbi:MAG TPA: DUF2147 domain-containing protein [Sphingomicrobium sp.]|nr:DUF2147 domain-containing protein [Sphingomicrobium sp.]